MKRILAALLVCALALPLCACGKKAEENNAFIRLNNTVTMDMLRAEHWVKNDADESWMTVEQIKSFNSQNDKMIGFEGHAMSLTELSESMTRDDLLYDLNALAASVEGKGGFVDGKPIAEDFWKPYIDNCNIDGVPETLNLRCGFSTCRASLRLFPSDVFVGETETDLFYDEMVMSEYLPYMPLVVTHESADGEWYFVYMYGFGGWIQKEYVALCESRGDWLARREPADFLVVTGRELRLSDDLGCPALSGQLLPMGTKLPLVKPEDAPDSISGRVSFNSYIVKLPVRDEKGYIRDEYALVGYGEDVSVGYLPYNGDNVVRLAMKRVGDRYGWAGLNHSNDCSGVVREVYSCFGIELPRVAWQQAAVTGAQTVDMSEMSTADKLKKLKKLPAGTLLEFSGHIMIYLGMENDIPYVVSALGSFATEDMEVGTAMSVNSVVVNSLYIHRRSGSSWLDDIRTAVTIK